jgi:hypothetical protein
MSLARQTFRNELAFISVGQGVHPREIHTTKNKLNAVDHFAKFILRRRLLQQITTAI